MSVFQIGSPGTCSTHGVERVKRVKIGMPYCTDIWECPECEKEYFNMIMEYESKKTIEERVDELEAELAYLRGKVR